MQCRIYIGSLKLTTILASTICCTVASIIFLSVDLVQEMMLFTGTMLARLHLTAWHERLWNCWGNTRNLYKQMNLTLNMLVKETHSISVKSVLYSWGLTINQKA